MLEFDLMAVRDPALDLAYLLAHLDLRVGQEVASDAAGSVRSSLPQHHV